MGPFHFQCEESPSEPALILFFSLPPLKLTKYSEPCCLMNSGSISQPPSLPVELNRAKTSQVSMHAHNVMEAVSLRRAFALGTVVFCSYNTIKTSAQVRIAFGAPHIQDGLVRIISFVFSFCKRLKQHRVFTLSGLIKTQGFHLRNLNSRNVLPLL